MVDGDLFRAIFGLRPPPEPDLNDSSGESKMSQILYASVVREMAIAPPGMEVVWQKTRILDSNTREVLQESEEGQIDNHLHQRAARPWTYLGPDEPYIYEYRMVHDVMPTGQLAEIVQIIRTPNVSPATRDERYEAEPPRVSAGLDRHMYEDENGYSRIPVSMLVKGVSRWNRPLRPRPEASEAEQQMVRQSQLDYDRNRLREIEQVTADIRRELDELGGLYIFIIGSNGWIRADIPVDVLEVLSSDVRLEAISSTVEENIDDACYPSCWFTSVCENNETGCFVGFARPENTEWFLGDGARRERVDAQQFYNLGIYGNYAQGPYNSLAVGVMEIGFYEDEAFFDKYGNGVSRAKKYSCEEYLHCTLWLGPVCLNWEWRSRCVQSLNFPDLETNCNDLVLGSTTWRQAGCHGTGVASIAVGRNYDGLMNGHQLGDGCWISVPGQPEHCSSLSPRSQGMAPEAKPIYVATWGNGKAAVGTLMQEEVDVINMSFGAGASDINLCNPLITSSTQSELENAFDQGIFLVNSTGNYGADHIALGFTKEQCLTNPNATLPKVFAVAGILNRIYQYGLRSGVWETGYNASHYPVSPDDYFTMRVDPFASQTGGANLNINGFPHARAMTVVDLVAPQGGWNATQPDGQNGQLDSFFSGSSGAAPHVSGLSMLVKQYFLPYAPLMNYPGWLHTVMLAMGDRSTFNTGTHTMTQNVFGGDNIYGFGKIKLRMPSPGNFRFIPKTWTAGNFPTSPFGYTERIWPYPSTSSHRYVKGVMNQIEDMTGKNPNDMVSDFAIYLAQTNQTYAGTCPSSFETACVQSGTCTYTSDESRDVKKMLRRFSSTGMAGRCHYVQIIKRHITSHNASVQVFFYRMDRQDHENSN